MKPSPSLAVLPALCPKPCQWSRLQEQGAQFTADFVLLQQIKRKRDQGGEWKVFSAVTRNLQVDVLTPTPIN